MRIPYRWRRMEIILLIVWGKIALEPGTYLAIQSKPLLWPIKQNSQWVKEQKETNAWKNAIPSKST